MKILKSKKIMIPSICGLVAIIITVILIVALVPKNTKAKQMALSSYFGDIEINNGKKILLQKKDLSFLVDIKY